MIFSDLVKIFQTEHFSIFEPPQKGRNEVLERKGKSFFQTEFHGDFEKNTVCAPDDFFFDQMRLLKK